MGTFLGTLGKTVGDAAIGGLTGGIGGAISNAVGGLFGGLFDNGPSQKEIMEMQHKYNLETMAIQNKYNQEAARQSQEYNKELWDYTNTENQIKHLKAANLNPALIYGMNGGGGAAKATGDGANQQGVSMLAGNPVEMGLRAKEIQQSLEMQRAEINAKNAEAYLNRTEAEKKGGVDTENTIADTERKRAEAEKARKQGNLYEAQQTLVNTQDDLAKETITKVQGEQRLLEEQIIKTANEAYNILQDTFNTIEEAKQNKMRTSIISATMADQIEAYSLSNAAIIAEIAKKYSDIEVNEAQIQELGASVKELIARASRHDWDKETFRKEVEGQVERWGDQTFNERLKIGVDVGLNVLNKIWDVVNLIKKAPTVIKGFGGK